MPFWFYLRLNYGSNSATLKDQVQLHCCLKRNMANTLDPMDLKQIITLHKDGFSNRAIGDTLGISRNTVNNYMKLIKGCEYSFEKLLTFDHATLASLTIFSMLFKL